MIAFGQQPCGFFPRRYLVAKIRTARRLQSEIGGRVVYFCHDSDHDPRETRTILRHRTTDEPASLNFAVGLEFSDIAFQLPGVGTFFMTGTRFRLPARLRMTWVTATLPRNGNN